MTEPNKPCRRCGHPFKDHCKGNVDHAYHKNASQYKPSAIIHCHTKHCEAHAMCSCVEFVGDGKEFVAYMRESIATYGQCTVHKFQLELLSDEKHSPDKVLAALAKKFPYEELAETYVFHG